MPLRHFPAAGKLVGKFRIDFHSLERLVLVLAEERSRLLVQRVEGFAVVVEEEFRPVEANKKDQEPPLAVLAEEEVVQSLLAEDDCSRLQFGHQKDFGISVTKTS